MNKAVEMVLVAVFGALLAMVVTKPAEVRIQPAMVQQVPLVKGVEAQTYGSPK